MSVRSIRTARTARTRLLAAAALSLATLTLTACSSGEGAQDEGASAASSSTSTPAAKPAGNDKDKDKDQANEGTTTGNAQGTAGSSQGSTGTSGSTGSTGSTGSKGSGSDGEDASTTRVACSGANTKTTATEVSRPLNHMLLTVTNTGSKNCDLTGYPAVRFGEAQSVPPAFEDSKPQAVVTLAPGESGYAGVLLASADGSGSNGYTAKSLTVHFGSGASASPSLPAKGVAVDDSLTVTYWQSTMDDALAW
ncbi:DUF4232 domain-containing protein [Streptomyces sp. HC44]|uniref:DUF4232 domain-containing protein n=1 Tax=Streptomyces scabichelini TaxID=2711217 RepID=A0A6G4VC40_9ACTN|nr:DUF4232 domain-containing protein [Streptomyces scabichelini]NGO11692.1 DUF4232 domain-containing protein [Streptomyces scabichelini]